METEKSEHIEMRGDVSVRGYNERGELVYEFDKQNLVVTGGKSVMANLLAYANSDFVIDGIGFGTGSAAPALTDTGLTGSFTKPLGAVSFPSPNSVKWEWVLDFSEFNGNTLRELGLYSGFTSPDPATLFARIVTSPTVKTSTLRLEGSWKITF
jgi:hypothetical protein